MIKVITAHENQIPSGFIFENVRWVNGTWHEHLTCKKRVYNLKKNYGMRVERNEKTNKRWKDWECFKLFPWARAGWGGVQVSIYPRSSDRQADPIRHHVERFPGAGSGPHLCEGCCDRILRRYTHWLVHSHADRNMAKRDQTRVGLVTSSSKQT